MTDPVENNVLIIFIKTPIKNAVKTRLEKHLTADQVFRIYCSFLKDLNRKFTRQPAFDTWYAVSPEHFDPEFLREHIDTDRLFLQSGAGIGERMLNAFKTVFGKGYIKAQLIGSDIPHLPGTYLDTGWKILDRCDLALGPSTDGGYYLIGLKKVYPQLFAGITWSTDHVLAETRAIAKQRHLQFEHLPTLSDVDTIDELLNLYQHLANVDPKDPDFPVSSWQLLKECLRD